LQEKTTFVVDDLILTWISYKQGASVQRGSAPPSVIGGGYEKEIQAFEFGGTGEAFNNEG